MKREISLIKNMIIIAIGSFLPKIANFITLPIITAGLTKSEYGTYDLICVLISFFLPIITLQIHTAAFRFMIDCRDDEQEINLIVTNIYCFIVPISVIALIVLYFLLSSVDSILRIIICMYFFLDILLLSTQEVVRGLNYMKLYSGSSVLRSIVSLVLIVICVGYADKGIVGVLGASMISTGISFIFLFYKAQIWKMISLSKVSLDKIKILLDYSWPMIPNSLSMWILNVSDRVILSLFLGVEANAIYAVANKIPSLFTTFKGTFITAWQENASVVAKDEDASAYYSNMFSNIFGILVGIMALLIAMTPFIFPILIHGDYAKSYEQLPILFLGIFFSALSSFLGGIYVAYKKTKSVGATTLCAAVINLIVNLLLVRSIGVYAASISTLVSYVYLTLYRMINVQKFQKLKYKKFEMLVGIIGLLIMCFVNKTNILAFNLLNILIGCSLAIVMNKQLIKFVISYIKSKMSCN